MSATETYSVMLQCTAVLLVHAMLLAGSQRYVVCAADNSNSALAQTGLKFEQDGLSIGHLKTCNKLWPWDSMQ